MKTIGNILWFLFVGLELGLMWFFSGVIWSITILGIPVGLQCFKIASLVLFPFGKQIVYTGNGWDVLINILWILISGIWIAIGSLILGVFCCITIIGIPFGLQYFKYAKLALAPFGLQVVKI